MREIITLSFGQTAGHINADYFNSQEHYFPLATKSTSDPAVRFRRGVATDGHTETYNPRLLTWELKGGYGAFQAFNQFYTEGDKSQSQVWIEGEVKEIKEQPVDKNEYQKALDLGRENASQLSTDTTKRWTDYNRLLHHPKTRHQLDNWVFDPETAPQGLHRGGDQNWTGFDVGVNEWENVLNSDKEYLDSTLRSWVEECDSLGGLNVVVDDSAWAGVAAKILANYRDDFDAKGTVVTWSVEAKPEKKTRETQKNAIQTTVALSQVSSIYIPVSFPSKTPIDADFDPTSPWHQAALFGLSVYEPVQLLATQRTGGLSLDAMAALLDTTGERNIVSEVGGTLTDADGDKSTIQYDSKLFQELFLPSRVPAKTPHVFSDLSIARLEDQEDDANSHRLNQPMPEVSSQPEFTKQYVSSKTRLAVTTKPRRTLLDMAKFVSIYERGDEREEMKQELGDMASKYEHGWEDDSDDDDDDC